MAVENMKPVMKIMLATAVVRISATTRMARAGALGPR
jgi:hypothetical protein